MFYQLELNIILLKGGIQKTMSVKSLSFGEKKGGGGTGRMGTGQWGPTRQAPIIVFHKDQG